MDDSIELSYEQARQLKEVLGSLLASEGWKFVATFMERRAADRERELYAICPNSIESMVAFAQVRGAIQELRLIPEMLAQVYMDVETSIHKMQDEDATVSDTEAFEEGTI